MGTPVQSDVFLEIFFGGKNQNDIEHTQFGEGGKQRNLLGRLRGNLQAIFGGEKRNFRESFHSHSLNNYQNVTRGQMEGSVWPSMVVVF